MFRRALLFAVPTLLAVALGLSSCGKGDTGPTGPQGPAGPAGSPNVQHSAWMVTGDPAARDTTIDGTLMKYYTLTTPAITQAVLDSAVVLTYFRVGTIGPYLLPYESTAGGADNIIGSFYKVGKIFVTRVTPSAAAAGNLINMPTSLEYRYVIIPGGVNITRAMPDVDWNDYDSVRRAFGWQD